MRNEHKFCFILCTNNKQYEEECLFYIRHLLIPTGYQVEVLTITDAASMCKGYNEGMNSTDAKYKIYLHQDVFIVNQHFLEDILEIFQDKSVGMIGMVGCPMLSDTGIQWDVKRCGAIHICNILSTFKSDFCVCKKPYEEVEAVDGLMMVTQYDLPWREDLFKKFDFYDTSQSKEFVKAGYKVVVPFMEQPWCIHDDGIIDLKNYYHDRDIFLKYYQHQE